MTFTNSVELSVLQTRLDAEEIEFLVFDELTTQVNPLYSNAIGGVRLQVQEKDIPRTIEILKEGGYIKEEDFLPMKSFTKFDDLTSRLPLLKNLRLELRLMVIVALGSLALSVIIYFVTLPPKLSTLQRLTKHGWCVDNITYNGKHFSPNTIEHIQITGMGFCQENIDIRTNRTIVLPGFNSKSSWGQWTLKNDSLYISHTDTFDFVYNGSYYVNFSDNILILKSSQTIIYCHPQNINVNISF